MSRLSLIDLLKALACQVILWHHFAKYGPMSDAVAPEFPQLVAVLTEFGPLAVPAFLAMGGFLASRTLLRPGAPVMPARMIGRRYLRLALPYLPALALALAAAFAARALTPHPDNPAAPGIGQILAHALMLQDLLGVDAFTAGAWYVAIDFQLFALLAGLHWLSSQGTRGPEASRRFTLICLAVTALSLFWLNLDPDQDVWAPYFFAAYGLGVLAERISRMERKGPALTALALLAGAALLVDWRSRILVAAVVALVLAVTGGRGAGWTRSPAVARLGDISYAVFLVHYPVVLAVGALVGRLFPDDPDAALGGMFAAWLISLLAGSALEAVTARGFAPEPTPKARPAA
ncbi:MAG: acyltransferase family protein [Rhodocyclaceae bacterium]|nr:acyltransferase family protein [Rhodocyclaceae bacterium]